MGKIYWNQRKIFLIEMKHLKENNISYWEHWWRAMKISGALFIHAWYPDVLKDYASKELSK